MQRTGVALSTVHYNTIIDGYAKAKLFDHVFRYFSEMRAAKIAPDAYTYSSLITAFINADMPDKAMEVRR